MHAFDELSDGLARAWDSLSEGWRQLRERAGNALTRFNPQRRHADLESGDERIMQQASRWGLLAAELRETEREIRVRLEVPGLEADQIDIQVEGDTLWVRGEKRMQSESREGRFHILECAYGAFERAIPLPAEVDDGAARAQYKRGVLNISLPKTRTAQRHRIDIEG